MEYTNGNLRLAKPQLSDIPDITRMNPNWDKIDENISSFDSKINVLSNERGYVNTSGTQNLNDCVKNGKYHIYFNGDGVEQNAPSGIVAGENTFTIDVTQQNDEVLTQEICGVYGVNQGRKFYRVNTFGSWTKWKEVSTTEKTEISLVNGFEPVDVGRDELMVSKTGNICTICGRIINKTIAPNNQLIGTIPIKYRPKKYRIGYAIAEEDSSMWRIEVKPNGEFVVYESRSQTNQKVRINMVYDI